ncbi:hypothetical protein BLNAU_18834 [Blattamonas nauphoetae]|uniref:Uncharacterized protein n=1 Tax=Blattamonas nauphoetae TaxID=2049346 RepID=A0ABQ9X392_9EUKA|nr:hypothetical protein BLNAU_18834 [Blattamonas nauphoetae]
MKAGLSPSISSELDHSDRLTLWATEENPIERFDELLASYSNPNRHYHEAYPQALIALLWRCLDHLKVDERRTLLLRFGVTMSQRDIENFDLESLATIVSCFEDVLTLFHISGLSHSILKQIQPNQTIHRNLYRLAQLSEIFPLVSFEPLSTDLSSLLRYFLCHPQPYLAKDSQCQSSFSALADILCNEMMACSILGIGDAVYETIVSNFPAFSEAVSREGSERILKFTSFGSLQKIVKISQNEHDPLRKIAAFISHLPKELVPTFKFDVIHWMYLLSQCLQHTATFLNAHPDLIDSFLETVDLSSSPSDTLFRHDRHLNLISALSQSSSPLFTKLSEPLLGPTFPLRSLLSPRSFTDPASSFIRMASTNSAFFRRLVERHARHILDIAFSTVVSSVRVVSDSPAVPRCLDFGRATQNWVVLLNTIAEVKMDLTLNSKNFNSIPSSLLTLLVLSAASTHDELSTAAVSVISNQFGLSTPHTEALLFATPTTFPVSDAFSPRHSRTSSEADHNKDPFHTRLQCACEIDWDSFRWLSCERPSLNHNTPSLLPLLLSRAVSIVRTAKCVERQQPTLSTHCTDNTGRHRNHPHLPQLSMGPVLASNMP